jgi:hypothetical protein
MQPDPTPAEVGHMHALNRAAEAVQDIAAAHEQALAHPGLGDDGRAYLTAVVTTARSIAERLRNSPGAKP